jgi:hypothetical protein
VKRTRYDSEYDRVRREAGFDKPQYEFPEEQEEVESVGRVRQMQQDFAERAEAMRAAEAEKSRQMSAELDARRAEFSDRVIRREYAALGIVPPTPLVSLSLLRLMGWSVEQIGDEFVLVKPPAPPRREWRIQDEST